MPRKAKYYRRPDGLYETIKKVNGKRVAFRGKTCAEVDRKLLEYNADLTQGRKFPVIADEWYEALEPTLAISTRRNYLRVIGRLKKAFPDRISKYRALDIQRYVAEYERSGYSASTVHIEMSTLRQIFSYAVMQGDINSNPAREVRKSRNLPVKKRSALTEEQERKVEAYRGEHWLFGLMLLYTGCRRGELLALTWQDIDREAGVIRVNKKLNYDYAVKPHLDRFLKNKNAENNNGEERIVPLLAPLAAVLPRNRIGKIFTNADGEYLTQSQLSAMWRTYCRGVGFVGTKINEKGKEVETFPITPHCFRHSFATLCFEAGIDPKTAAAYIGDTEAVTQRVYTELRKGKHIDGIERLNAYLEMRAAEKNETRENA